MSIRWSPDYKSDAHGQALSCAECNRLRAEIDTLKRQHKAKLAAFREHWVRALGKSPDHTIMGVLDCPYNEPMHRSSECPACDLWHADQSGGDA